MFVKEEQACILDFEVTACVNLRSCTSCVLHGGHVWSSGDYSLLDLGARFFSFLFCFFLFSVKAVLYSHLVFPLEESSVFVPLRDTCALPDSYTGSVAVSKPRGVCSLVG